MGHLVIDAASGKVMGNHMDKIKSKKPNLTDYNSQVMEVSDQPLPPMGAQAPIKVKTPPAPKGK